MVRFAHLEERGAIAANRKRIKRMERRITRAHIEEVSCECVLTPVVYSHVYLTHIRITHICIHMHVSSVSTCDVYTPTVFFLGLSFLGKTGESKTVCVYARATHSPVTHTCLNTYYPSLMYMLYAVSFPTYPLHWYVYGYMFASMLCLYSGHTHWTTSAWSRRGVLSVECLSKCVYRTCVRVCAHDFVSVWVFVQHVWRGGGNVAHTIDCAKGVFCCVFGISHVCEHACLHANGLVVCDLFHVFVYLVLQSRCCVPI